MVPPQTAREALSAADDTTADTFLTILGKPEGNTGEGGPHTAWQTPRVFAQAQLPTALGGAGISRLVMQAEAAHVVSRANVLPLLLRRYEGAPDVFSALTAEIEDVATSTRPWASALRDAHERTQERIDQHTDLSDEDEARGPGTIQSVPTPRRERAGEWSPADIDMPDLDRFTDAADDPATAPPPKLLWGLQYAAGLRGFIDLWHSSDDIARCRLGAVASQADGGAFLARDQRTSPLALSRDEHLIAARRVIGLLEPLCAFDSTCPGCSQPLASAEMAVLHYPSCQGPCALAGTARTQMGNLMGHQMTHRGLVKAVGRMTTEAGHCVLEEVPGLFANSCVRPGDCTVLGYYDGRRHLAIDVACTRLNTPTNLAAAGRTPGSALESVERRKRAKYETLIENAQGTVAFVPFITNEYGAIGDHGQQFMHTLARQATKNRRGGHHERGETTGSRKAELLHKWRSYISVAIHRTQAQIIMMMSARASKNNNIQDTEN
jgi:hypothetical protein